MRTVNSSSIPDDFRLKHDINSKFKHVTEILLLVFLPSNYTVEVALLDVYDYARISFEKAFGSPYHVVLEPMTSANLSNQPGVPKQLDRLRPRKAIPHRTPCQLQL